MENLISQQMIRRELARLICNDSGELPQSVLQKIAVEADLYSDKYFFRYEGYPTEESYFDSLKLSLQAFSNKYLAPYARKISWDAPRFDGVIWEM